MSKTFVLIHGYGFDSRIWNPVELAFNGHHVISLSLPGFGENTLEGAYTIEQLAKHFWSDIDKRIAPEVHLVGHSMGGYVCLEMAAQLPSRIKSLALIHSHVFADTDEKKSARTSTMEDIKKNGRSGLVHKMIPSLFGDGGGSKEIIDALIQRGMAYDDDAWYRGTQAIRDRKDHARTLEELKVPVLMIMGNKDVAVPPELAYKQAPLAEKTILHVYPDAGHLAMYENTAQMIGDLIRFYTAVI
jgi:pimeloyl-ACP methyl ester carboxylesterase